MTMALRKTLLDCHDQTASIQGDIETVHEWNGLQVVGELQADTNSTGTLNVIVYHGPNINGPWKALFTFTQITNETDNVERFHSDMTNTVPGPCFYAGATIASSGDYDFSVYLYLGS
jgi:hypothetical protein